VAWRAVIAAWAVPGDAGDYGGTTVTGLLFRAARMAATASAICSQDPRRSSHRSPSDAYLTPVPLSAHAVDVWSEIPQKRYLMAIVGLTIFVGMRTAIACYPLGPLRFVVEPSVVRAPPVIAGATASVRRSDPTSSQPCSGLSWLTIGVRPAPTESVGISIEPIVADPLVIGLDYGLVPVRLDATGRVNIPFYTDGRALDFGLRLVPLSLPGTPGKPFEIRIQEPALPGLYQFLFRHRGTVYTVIIVAALLLVAAMLFYRRARRGRAAVEQIGAYST
jgi:hypothetical protein